MRKALFPMIASLALCGAATAALIATNARAEQGGRKPVMLALVTPDKASPRAIPAPHTEEGPDTREAMEEPRREQVCKFLYARKAGELAFLEAKLSLSANQAPLFARWKQVSLDVAKQHESDCTAHQRPAEARGKRLSVVDRLALEEDLLKRRLSDIQAERPALSALYAALTPAQKQEFGQDGLRRMVGRMHRMLGMMDHPGMGPGAIGHGPMGRGPMGPMEQPPEPPLQ
ncbi:MAG TPA: Spy/CpxP family protein refolding chaperone [Rhizomicrobium sp.]|nr:Spy/CpxP family protein refolding chaperone [Rhizomicrobium sp.]